MSPKLLLEISGALLIARWKQTLVAAIGVTFGITMFISLLGFMNGLNKMLDGLVSNRTAHVRLYNNIKPTLKQPIYQSKKFSNYYHFLNSVKPAGTRKEIYNVDAIIAQLKTDERILGISPRISAQVFYTLGSINLNGVINGVDVDAEAKLFFFKDYVTSGNYDDLTNISNSIILGKGVVETMLTKIGDIVFVTTPTGEQFPLKVVGYFQSGIADYDKVQSYASISTTQKILGKPSNYISDVLVKLKDINKSPEVAHEFQNIFMTDAEAIQTANAQFETGSNVRSIISYAVGITLLIVAGFGIYNILNMLIYEKMDTIAILKATGFSGSDVKRIFISIALAIGVCGAVAGFVFGFLLCNVIDNIPFQTAALPTIKTFPIDYNPKYYLIAGGFAILTTYLAGWFPAQKASKIDPVIIIRGK